MVGAFGENPAANPQLHLMEENALCSPSNMFWLHSCAGNSEVVSSLLFADSFGLVALTVAGTDLAQRQPGPNDSDSQNPAYLLSEWTHDSSNSLK